MTNNKHWINNHLAQATLLMSIGICYLSGNTDFILGYFYGALCLWLITGYKPA